ncbi:uncharacterized protein LOC113232064 [Hyposmocoma kahamanoa]|uniref:uncharacterized protein LOC113232064 n=1 Tax=Hyposmocoma kahamanoa TaxID=1477025 RepID=UPI000E6D737C|nr:uncharacterized protein LOC113232064 [Hyposmocoma kahamanoa]
MSALKSAWLAATAPALEKSTGKLELAFFECVYRTTYATGLSFSDKQTMYYYIYSYTVKVIIVLFIASEFWYLFSISSSFDTVIDNITVTVLHFIYLYRYKTMMGSKVVYKKLAASLDSPYFDVTTTSRKKILRHWLKMQHKCIWLLLTISSCGLVLWYVHPLSDEIEYNYPATVRFPYDSLVRTTEWYIVAYIVVLFMFNYTSYLVVITDLIMQAQLIPLVCQYAVLCDCFENIITDSSKGFSDLDDKQLFANDKFQNIYYSRLRKLVEQHKIILAYALNKSMIKTIMNFFYLIYNMFMFYLLCNWCDEIKLQSQRVGDSVYLSGWERGAVALPGVRARLMIIVSRAFKPLAFSAGGISDLSLISYTTLVKTSYSALTVLLSVRQRHMS